MKKRGALELSVNTIVVIVIGVALLSLGLIFIKNLFTGIGGISDEIFNTAEITIGQLHQQDVKLTVPSQVNVKQGQKKAANIFVGNDGYTCGTGTQTFTLEMIPVSGLSIINGSPPMVKAKIISPTSVTLTAGQKAGFVVEVVAINNAPLGGTLDDPAYSVSVKCSNGQIYEPSAMMINVVKGGGLFG